jgi:50S ribosomal protein L16 3-hydroxylase
VFPPLRFPDGLDAGGFLQRHWQRSPLLMPGALRGLVNPLPADELAGLACEDGIEARIVRQVDRPRHGLPTRWQVEHGPFDPAHFAALPEGHWTLLVQDVDKQVPAVGALLDRFRFLPDWRVDDIMVSYAADQGSVGPHVDDYDVFLIQVAGRRRWRITTAPNPPLAILPDLDLRILSAFEPDRDWLLEPGDILYLPPGVPHWGIAEGDCLTWSVGFRAPAWREITAGWLAHVAERFSPPGRWRDPPDLAPPADAAELDDALIRDVRAVIAHTLAAAGDEDLADWLGALLTEPKENLELEAAEPPLTRGQLLDLLNARGRLVRVGPSQLLFSRASATERDDRLFANGHIHRLPPGRARFLSLLCNGRILQRERAAPWLDDDACADLLRDLYNAGHYIYPSHD